jgi:L-lactate dehydrogenase complex protein LldF
MSNPFHTRIRKSLADENLQSALDANAKRRIAVRVNAFASLPNSQELRMRARAVRADVIDHLDDYLAQFIHHAQENGMVIHHAANSAEAVRLVIEIAQSHGAKLVGKSKTMVSEEIELNPALEREGLEVIETDLGEYIVQLRGEPPAHIITPAVHLRRQDVGRLFQEKLGIPYTEDISLMTIAARQTLRQVFLNANIGISGVNFAVAETGTLCLVTNEGNGRMVTTVAPIHIALMGIERLVPTMDDLALVLSLLPRSATGQKLTAYTSLLNSPRRIGDPDGPQERHVILVDNGRRATRTSELREILYCIRCGSCLNACPVFREIGGHAYVSHEGKHSPYPGPVGSVVSPALFGQAEFGQLARASSLCGACREACPVDIDIPKLLLRVRAGFQADEQEPLTKPNAPSVLKIGLGFYSFAAASPWRFKFAQRLAGFFGSLVTIFSKRDPWIHLPGFSGWGVSKDFPKPVARPFHSRFPELAHVQPVALVKQEENNPSPPGEGGVPPAPKKAGFASFESELVSLGGHFIACSREELTDKILSILKAKDLDQLLVWESSQLPGLLTEQLSQAGIRLVQPSAENIEPSSRVGVGLTGAFAGLAETGSLLLLDGPGRPMTASLLPETHIAILHERDIVDSLDQLLNKPEVAQSSSAVLITGPSRTSDIEMTLTIGVHGPGELWVLGIKET